MCAVRVPVVEKIMSANDQVASINRKRLDENGIFAINLMASPGAGKTSLILQTIQAVAPRLRVGVIEGDTAPVTIDADKVIAAGMPAVQINTGGECHLDAVMINDGLNQLPLAEIDLLIVENVGNLICPAAFTLGTHANVLIATIPEGDDKPYKYPNIYRGLEVLIINKIDLKPYVRFNMDYFRQGVEMLNPGLVTFPVSCQTGEGISAWTGWLKSRVYPIEKGMTTEIVGLKIWVRGIVQGVGFRPFIYGLAETHHLTGWVRNTSSGVEIEVNGSQAGVFAFLSAIHDNPPPLARIDELAQPAVRTQWLYFFRDPFQPAPTGGFHPRVAGCEHLRGLPEASCSHRPTGAIATRLSTAPTAARALRSFKDIPYDRPKTTMAGFQMCPECQAEYDDPLDRRFHAQPTACPVCGPQLWYEENGQTPGEARRGSPTGPPGAESRQNHRGQRPGWVSPGLRCHQSAGRGRAAQAQEAQRQTLCRDGLRPGSRRTPLPGFAARRRAAAAHASTRS